MPSRELSTKDLYCLFISSNSTVCLFINFSNSLFLTLKRSSAALILNITFICVTSSVSSMGLLRKASAPSSRPFTLLALSVLRAVIRMIGICFVSLFFFNPSQTANPSISGMEISSKIKSGCSCFAILIPLIPFNALLTSTSSIKLRRSAFMEIKLSSLSSMINILGMAVNAFPD